MAFDGIVTKCIVTELSNLIINCKVNKIYEPTKNDIVLNLYGNSKNFDLAICTNSNFSRLLTNLKNANVEEKLILPVPCENSDPSWFGFMMTCKNGTDRNKIVKYIENKKIQTRMLFAGNIIKHPCFDSIRNTNAYRVVGNLENTDYIMNNTFWVGVYPGMTDKMIDTMSNTIIEALELK